MADEDKKGKAASGRTPAKSGSAKKAAVKKKAAKKKAAESGTLNMKIDFVFVVLLVIFLVVSLAVLRGEKPEEGALKQKPESKQTIKDTSAKKQADTASLPQETTKPAPPVAAPEALKEDFVPAVVEEGGNGQTAAKVAPVVVPRYPAMATPERPPLPSDTPAAGSVTAPVSEPAADVSPVLETAVAEPAMAVPAAVDVPAADTAAALPPAQIAEPAGSQVQAIEEPVQAVVTEAVTDQPAATSSTTQRGYNPYSRYPYGYRRGYRRDYDRGYRGGYRRDYDRGYPRRPPQRWSW